MRNLRRAYNTGGSLIKKKKKDIKFLFPPFKNYLVKKCK